MVSSLPSPTRPQVPDTRDLVSVDEDVPALTSTQLDLAAWMSGYYICSLFDAAQTMLPPGRRARLKAYFSTLDGDVDTQSLPGLQDRVLAYLQRRGEVAETRVVAAFGPGASGALRRLVRKGLVARADRRSAPSVTHKMRRMVRLSAPPPGGGIEQRAPAGCPPRAPDGLRRPPWR